ncbi:MAG TPA: TRAP transporter substrate-binding protein [Stellaceae bacterium]|nr:TRAP transporter substrate-binding protein [Stellaceae bacterium]
MKIGLGIFALVAGLAAMPALSRAADTVTLKFGFPAPSTSYVNTDGMTPWIKDVEKAAGGTLNIKLFAGPALGTFRDIYDRTINHVVEISFGVFGPLASEFPRTQVSDLPFLSNNTELSSVALWRLYASGALAPEYSRVKVLALFNFPSSLLNTHKPIKTIEDLKGQKYAVSSRMAGQVAEALGSAPVTLTPTEIYEALNRGVVDGAFIAWTAVRTFKLDEVTNHHLEAPLGEAPAFVFMNKDAYAKLPEKARHAIDEYSGESFSRRLGTANENADRGESKAVAAKKGQSVTKLTPEQYALWKKRIEPVINAWVKQTPDGAKVLAAYREELKKLHATD